MNFEVIYIKEEVDCKNVDVKEEINYQCGDENSVTDCKRITKLLSSGGADIKKDFHEDIDIKEENNYANFKSMKRKGLNCMLYKSSEIVTTSVDEHNSSYDDFVPVSDDYFMNKINHNISKNCSIHFNVASQNASSSGSVTHIDCLNNENLFQSQQISPEKTNLELFIQRNSSDKRFKCSDCDYNATRKADLEMHIRRHRGEKPFKCSLCDYRASQKSTLYRHIKSHTGERPFKCNDCDYTALEKSHLKRHIQCHTGEKPFECTDCNYSTSEKAKLKRHIRTHTGEKPYKCCECDYKASYRNSLLKHIMCHTG